MSLNSAKYTLQLSQSVQQVDSQHEGITNVEDTATVMYRYEEINVGYTWVFLMFHMLHI